MPNYLVKDWTIAVFFLSHLLRVGNADTVTNNFSLNSNSVASMESPQLVAKLDFHVGLLT